MGKKYDVLIVEAVLREFPQPSPYAAEESLRA